MKIKRTNTQQRKAEMANKDLPATDNDLTTEPDAEEQAVAALVPLELEGSRLDTVDAAEVAAATVYEAAPELAEQQPENYGRGGVYELIDGKRVPASRD